MADNILQAIALIRQGRKAEAQRILLALLKSDPRNELAWLWLVETLPNDAQRIAALEQCLKVNPASVKARQGLERLKARLVTPPSPIRPPEKPDLPAAQPSIPPAAPVDSPPSLPVREAILGESPALKKSRPRISVLEIILIGILVFMVLGIIGFFWWDSYQRRAAPQATATATTRLLPTLTGFPTITPTVPIAPPGTTPSGPGLLYFTGANGCVIRWASAGGGNSLPIGSLPADYCRNDGYRWSVKRWSPDGSLFALAMMDATGGNSPAAYSIQILRFDGTPLYQLIAGSGSIPPAGLAWSPNGSRLAYVVTQETESGADVFVLRVVPVDGRELPEGAYIQLSGEPISLDDMALPGQHIAWSPDGQALALSAADETKQNGLYLSSSMENAFSRLAGNLSMNVTVTWSPDGRLIAYNDGLDWKIILPDGDQQTVVSGDNTKDVFCIAWSPDSAELICTVRVPGGAQQLMAFRADGSGASRLLVDDAPLFEQSASNAQWLPDGTLLVLRDMEDYGLYVFNVENAALQQLRVETQEDFVWATPGEQTAATPSPTSTP